ncbi:MAM and LDL-receptor class A domain-containing protein 1-like [Littorina saxatilis]|uniref:MAM and LDL-receptor class A domain-containing protein 1-like n=1 Tax=Littorina saxatilis TaxID=31220 RepID=UPI0038B5530F
MYVDGSMLGASDQASLVSRRVLYQDYGPRCLTFWYHMYGGSTRNLQVIIYDDMLTTQLETWAADGSSIDIWRRAQFQFQLTLANNPIARVVFYVPGVNAISGDVAIDDVTVARGLCPYAINDVSVTTIDCDFNDPTGNICNYGQDFKTDKGDWIWTDKTTTATGQVTANPSGYFMLARSAGTSGPYRATMYSQRYKPPFPRSCVRFRYKISGGMNSELTVKIHTDSEQPFNSEGGTAQGTKQASATADWLQAEIDILSAEPVRLSFSAFTQGGNMETAIDDIVVVNRECGTLETFNCPFDDPGLCGFVQSTADDFDFDQQTTVSAPLKGPQTDHTSGDGTGKFVFTKLGNTLVNGFNGELHSPIIETDAPASCLVFWYFLQGESAQGTLQVKTSAPDLTGQSTVWSLAKGYKVASVPTDPWARAAITLLTMDPIRVTFAVSVTNNEFTTALDDISLTKGPCPQNLAVGNTFSCNLDAPDLCGLGQMTLLDNFDWLWNWGPSLPAGTGPQGDHTSGNGHYLYLESSSHHTAGEKAMVYTPTLAPSFPKSCLTFTYHMVGPDIGTLSVSILSAPVAWDQAVKVWSLTGEQADSWTLAQVDLDTTKPYKIMIEATTKSGDKGDIAIDDIDITNLECPASWVKSLKCSFEKDGCGFVQSVRDNFDWLSNSITNSPVFNGGPLRGRSNPTGHYRYIDSAAPRKTGDVAILASPIVDAPLPQSCLVFWYHLLDKAGATPGSLSVFLTLPSFQNPKTIWMRGRSQGNAWRRAAVTIDTPRPMRFVIRGSVGTPGQSNIAIDDVQLTKGPCFFDRQLTKLKCDFEDPEMCGFGQRNDDNFDWFWNSGPTPEGEGTGPAAHHTGNRRTKRQTNSGGHYMYIESSKPQVPGEKATMVTPKIRTTEPKNCLTFWYHMRGASVGMLKVLVLLTGNRRYPLWNRSGNQGNEWNKASVEMDASPVPFQLLFEGTVGQGTAGDIAIDDIELTEMPCPGEPSINCTFDQGNLCGYSHLTKQADHDWTQTTGGQTKGPVADHTGNGMFLYVGEHMPKTVLVSPSLDWSAQKSCLKFKYYLKTTNPGYAELNVYQAPTGMLNERVQIWNRTDNTGSQTEWSGENLVVDAMYPIQIIFEGVIGSGKTTSVAIDDIRIYPTEYCFHPVNCDFTDEKCSYEGAWDWQKGPTPTADTGPQADHTNGRGFYIVFNAATLGASETMKSGIFSWVGEVNCLSFWYHMYGADMGTLTLYTAHAADQSVDKQILWTRTGNKDQLWHTVQVEFRATTSRRLYIEAVKGSGARSDMAVDDIMVREGQRCNVPAPKSEVSPIDCDFSSDLCGFTQLTTDDSDWVRQPHTGNDATLYGSSFIRAERSLTKAQTIVPTLESPVLNGDPSHVCVSFWYHMKDSKAGTLSFSAQDVAMGTQVAQFSKSGPQSTGWQQAEVDFDLLKPVKMWFEASRTVDTNTYQLMADIGLDDITVTRSTCQPVPWEKTWEFRCDRPTTPCNTGLGSCNDVTHKCDCTSGVVGLQCTEGK